MVVDVESMRQRAYTLCRDYLHGAWQLIDAHQMTISQIKGGLSNLLYLCELPKHQLPLGDEPRQALLRIYGQVRDGAHDSTVTESVIFTLLAERRLGPKLYGIFPGGRLEEYMQARTLTCADLRDPDISQAIAAKLAAVHALEIPISKEPSVLWNTLDDWVRMSRSSLSDETLAQHPEKADCIRTLRQTDYEREIDWMKGFLARARSPVLFCHNDCQEGNILQHGGAAARPPRLTLIDYEYCSYNYRGFDIANHFCEWMYDYKCERYPHFSDRPDHWPDRRQQLRYIRAYLRARPAATSNGGNGRTAESPPPTETAAGCDGCSAPHSADATADRTRARAAGAAAGARVDGGRQNALLDGHSDRDRAPTNPADVTAPDAAAVSAGSRGSAPADAQPDCRASGNGELPAAEAGRQRRSSGEDSESVERAAEEEEEECQSAEEERILAEVQAFSLASHLFWTLWSIVNAPVSSIDFGYWEYGVCRLQAYQRSKEALLGSGQQPPAILTPLKQTTEVGAGSEKCGDAPTATPSGEQQLHGVKRPSSGQ